MAKLFGTLVGAAYAGGAVAKATSSAHERGTDHILRRDRIELTAAPVNDQVSLLVVPSNTVLDPLECAVHYDALGASVTLNAGIAGSDAALFSAHAASSAGNVSLFKSVDIANWFKPLWQVLGLAADPGGNIELLLTIKGAAATGTVVWSLKGQSR
ncbi:hypothetical protein [Brevundimonas sp.]|uniref:hypothetical protein n=1 Tax=Brevundimonas sp. TaxID=1871086 RepID=UPI00289744F6|nr:hypothetical protein [Brevundimonas sp.]